MSVDIVSKSNESTSPEVTIRSFRPGDERGITDLLAECHPGTWRGRTVEFWQWRNLKRPGASNDDIVIGEKNGEIVACYHGAVCSFAVDAEVDVSMSIDGDYAVHPDHRGGNITDLALHHSDRDLWKRGVALRGGFARRELNENFYRKRFGYVYVPSTTAWFRKPMAFERLQRRVARGGERLLTKAWLREALSRRSFEVELEVDEFPRCHLVVDGGAFALRKGPPETPDVVIHAPRHVAAAAAAGAGGLAKAVAASFVKGRIRSRGVLRTLPRAAAFVLDALVTGAGLRRSSS